MIPKSAGRRKACQRVCGTHLPHVFFYIDNVLHPMILCLDVFQTSRSVTKQHGLACGRVHCMYQGASPPGSSHVVQYIYQSKHACPQMELYSSASPLLHAITGCRLHQGCTKWTPTCSTLPLCDFRLLAPSAQSESVVSFALVFSSCCNG